VATGAVAVVISNYMPGNFLGTPGDYASPVPAVSVSQEDGIALTSAPRQLDDPAVADGGAVRHSRPRAPPPSFG